MIRGLKPYPRYTEADPFLHVALPAHWRVVRQRNAAVVLVSNVDKQTVDGELPVRLCNYVDVYKNEVITATLSFQEASATPDEVAAFRLRCGDVVITKDSESWDDIGVPALVGYEAEDLVCGYHLAILRPRVDVVLGAFLHRLQQATQVAAQYHVAANGVTRYGLSYPAIKGIRLPIPPLEEQRAIVQFLDVADRHISALVGGYSRLAGAPRAITDQRTTLLYGLRQRLITDVAMGQVDVASQVESHGAPPAEQVVDDLLDTEASYE